MKILITGTTGDSMPPPYGGIPKVSLLYAREWKRMGHDVAVTFVYKPQDADDFGANARYFFEYGLRPNKFRKMLFLARHTLKNPLLYFRFLFSYLRLYPKVQIETILYSAYGVWSDGVIATFKPDIILCETALIKTYMVLETARRQHVPVVIDTYAEVRDVKMGVNKHLSPRERQRYWSTFLSRAELIIGMSNCTDGPRSYLPMEKIREFYDTCDFGMSRSVPMESREFLRSYFQIPREAFVVGAVGAFELRKGHDLLIRAVAECKRKGIEIHVALCGAGDNSKWKEIAKEENVYDQVHFFSRLSELDLIRLHRSLDVYVNVSNSQRSCGLDLALLEAMASGLPIVVSDTGALPSAVHNKENGYVTITNNIQSITDALLVLYAKTDEDRKRMGDKSKEFAEKYDIAKTSVIKVNWLDEALKKYNIERSL